MMGKIEGQEQLCYEVRLDEHVPADHLLRRIDAVLDLSFVRPLLAPSYSSRGRPSVDPELMLRMLLIGCLYGIRSGRRLCEDVRFNLAYRRFCRLGLNGAVPDHSTVSKNRHGRFRACGLFRALFERMVERCIAAGLAAGQDMAVDASVVIADASPARHKPGDTALANWGDREAVSRPVREYLYAIEATVPLCLRPSPGRVRLPARQGAAPGQAARPAWSARRVPAGRYSAEPRNARPSRGGAGLKEDKRGAAPHRKPPARTFSTVSAGFLVIAKTSFLRRQKRQISHCVYERQLAPCPGSFLVILRPCSSVTSGSRRAMVRRRLPPNAMRCSRPVSSHNASTRISRPAGMHDAWPGLVACQGAAVRQHARAVAVG